LKQFLEGLHAMQLTALWWWIDRWRKSTAYMDMTLEAQGAYRNLLDEAWLREGSLPNDERILAKACGDATRWPAVRAVVLAHFVLTGDTWRNTTLDDVLRQSERRAVNQRNYRLRRASDNAPDNAPDNGGANDPANKPDSPDPDPSPSLISGSGSGSVSGDVHRPAAAPPLLVDPARVASAKGTAHTNGQTLTKHREALSRTLTELRAGFDEFWARYPRHADKKAAEKAWFKLRPSLTLQAVIFTAVDAQKASVAWRKDGGQFIPYAATWLNHARWDDDIRPPPNALQSEASLHNTEAFRIATEAITRGDKGHQ
jgi:uncharacterized protein YdaU (DUF1376 family)